MQFASGMLDGGTFKRDYGSHQDKVNLGDTQGTQKEGGGIYYLLVLPLFLVFT